MHVYKSKRDNLLENIILRCATFVYAVEHLFNDVLLLFMLYLFNSVKL